MSSISNQAETKPKVKNVTVVLPEKSKELNLDNAELCLQKLHSGESSNSVDVIAVAAAALQYYILHEEHKLS